MTVAPQSAIPVLRVADYPRARAFYVEKLGFRVTEEGGEPPRFGILWNGKAELFLNAWDGADPAREVGWRVYLHVSDAEDTATALRIAGIEIKRGPEDAPYGLREVEIDDPDGNRLCFGQILEETS
ncbi:MAG: glyoxalase superfamily protein [Pseudomonadota bacterium]